MGKDILATVDPFEVRVAVREDGRLAGIFLERSEPLAGNVYKGRVASVLPGMEAAFVDIGLERNAFLHVTDIRSSRIEPEGGEELEDRIGRGPIADRLRVGQEILVQVTKEPRGTKGARATTYVALPGHYVVLMPTVTGVGVSRRIDGDAERKRLRAAAERLRPDGMGLIVRTAAEGVAEQDLGDDVRFLVQVWAKITDAAATSRAPAVLYQDLGLIQRVVRDLFTGDVDRFILDSAEEYGRVQDLVGTFGRDLRDRVQLHRGPDPIFDTYGVEREIERALHRKVWLRSGGYLVFDRTEAATVIDVNTGKYVGKTDLASTILRTNLEAADEIARQIRLRDIGGIILVDFIDMEAEKHRRRVLGALNDAVRADRTKVHVIDLTQLGLVEITRKRVHQDLEEVLRMPCPYCEGRGRVLSPESAAVRAGRELRRAAATARGRALIGYVHPEVARVMEEHAGWLEALGQERGKTIAVRPRPGMHLDRIVVAQGDDLAAAERAATNGQAAKAAQVLWLDPIHGEGLDLPEDELREHAIAGAGGSEAAPSGWLGRLWRLIMPGPARRVPRGDGPPAPANPAGAGRTPDR